MEKEHMCAYDMHLGGSWKLKYRNPSLFIIFLFFSFPPEKYPYPALRNVIYNRRENTYSLITNVRASNMNIIHLHSSIIIREREKDGRIFF